MKHECGGDVTSCAAGGWTAAGGRAAATEQQARLLVMMTVSCARGCCAIPWLHSTRAPSQSSEATCSRHLARDQAVLTGLVARWCRGAVATGYATAGAAGERWCMGD